MKAIIAKAKGSFDNMTVENIDKPVIEPDEFLVKVHAAGVNPGDWKTVLFGNFPLRLF